MNQKTLKLLLIAALGLCMCMALTGCGNEETEQKNEVEDVKTTSNPTETAQKKNNTTNSTTKATNTPKSSTISTASATNTSAKETPKSTAKKDETKIDMPENVRIYSYQDYGNNTGVYFDVTKIGNNALRTQVSTAGESRKIQNNKGYHYFKYKGDNKWDIYYRTDSKDWYLYSADATVSQFNTFMNINYSVKEDSELQGKEHEKIHVEGVGDVDTVHIVREDGSADRLVDEWYSKELKRFIKSRVQYTGVESEILTYDTSVKAFGIAVP